MAKKILLFMLLCMIPHGTIIAQKTQKIQDFPEYYQEEYPSPEEENSTLKRKVFLGIENRFGILSALGPNSPIYTTAVNSIIGHLIVPVYKNLSITAQFRAGFPLYSIEGALATSPPMVMQSSTTLGFYVGFGGFVMDKRTPLRGWTAFLSGGVFTDFAVRNFFLEGSLSYFTIEESIRQYYMIGLEFSFSFDYHFNKYSALRIGGYLDWRIAPFSGDPFYVNFDPLQVPFYLIGFGFSLGFIF